MISGFVDWQFLQDENEDGESAQVVKQEEHLSVGAWPFISAPLAAECLDPMPCFPFLLEVLSA